MSNAVLISIRPQWCELICNGKKTIEVRKSRPKLDTPFKCYIYCTKGKNQDCKEAENFFFYEDDNGCVEENGKLFSAFESGKVIGEFACDSYIGWGVNPLDGLYMIFPHELTAACLTGKEFEQYGNGKALYGWHISALQIYDKPKELGEFTKFGYDAEMPCCRLTHPPQSWCYVEELEEPCKTKN